MLCFHLALSISIICTSLTVDATLSMCRVSGCCRLPWRHPLRAWCNPHRQAHQQHYTGLDRHCRPHGATLPLSDSQSADQDDVIPDQHAPQHGVNPHPLSDSQTAHNAGRQTDVIAITIRDTDGAKLYMKAKLTASIKKVLDAHTAHRGECLSLMQRSIHLNRFLSGSV